MSEMVERVAKAQAGDRWNSLDDEHKDAARSLARAAIETMMAPTQEMVEAGDDCCGIYCHGRKTWYAMIAAALK